MARPRKLSTERIEGILKALETGMPRYAAAAAVGIDYDTLRVWVKADPELSVLVERAERKAVANHVANIANHALGNWTASAWLLERRYPDEFGRRDRVDLQVSLKSQVEEVAAETGLSSEEVWAELATILPGAR